MSNSPENTDLSLEPTDSRCAICNAGLSAGAVYVVRIDIFADPAWPDSSLPATGTEIQESLSQVIGEIESMTADELQDGVHRRFAYRICPHCQPKMLSNPLGLPRLPGNATN